MNSTTLSFPLLIFLLLSVLPSSSSNSDYDAQISDCVPISCGSVTDISCPFWVPDVQPNYCGLPQFELKCYHNETLSLQTPIGEYDIHNIFYHNHSILVTLLSPKAVCSIYGNGNLNFSHTPFNISHANREIVLFSNCIGQLPPSYFTIHCHEGDIFWILAGNYNLSEHFPVSSGCVIEYIPVLGTSGAKTSDYNELVKDGFLLEWSAADCSKCSASGGQCGSKSCNVTRSHVKQIVIGVGVGGGILVMCFICCIWYYRRRIMWQPSSSAKFLIRTASCNVDQEMCSNSYRTHVFSYAELHEATNGFDESKEIGDGGFGTVYKGQLQDGRVVAVKRLYENNYKRVEQFLNEVDILSRIHHKNLVALYGCTSRHSRELLLVYEFLANGTVADHLHGPHAPENGLTWGARLNIAIETADALAYLHAIEPPIIHRDVKTDNILLDDSFHVKVADFGLSRLFPVDATHVSTVPQGTPGYVDPEYHQCYHLTDKSDVYSFGVVLVELISSLPAVDISRHRHEINLANLAVTKIQNREIEQLVDPRLGYSEDREIEKMINMVAELAFRCLQGDRDMRPTIKEVLAELKQIENKGERVVEAGEIGDEARLLKSEVPYSPDTVTVRWDSKTTTPNTSA